MSRRSTRLLPRLVILLIAIAAQFPDAPSGEDVAPLTVDEIVRMHSSGVSARDLRVKVHRTEQVAFDLSEGMLAELREAGLPEEVIAAMIERQAHEDRKRRALAIEDEPDFRPQGEPGTLTLRLNPEEPGPKKRRIRVLDQHEPRADRRFQTGDSRYVDLGLFVACTTPDHVPDHWRLHTPLVNTFLPVPRHRMLSFVGGATWTPSGLIERLQGSPAEGDDGVAASERDRLGLLELALPPALVATLARGIAHDLVFGLALATENGFTVWAVAERRDVVLDGPALELDAKIRVRGKDVSTAAVSLEGGQAGDP